jgi:hypothetical protein
VGIFHLDALPSKVQILIALMAITMALDASLSFGK